jgi:pteridine reductase
LQTFSNDPRAALGPHGALCGKTALITGAARRVGAAIARTLHGAGANVVLHYRNSWESATELARELNGVRPGSAVLAKCDLLQVSQLPALADASERAFGGLDILVNSASTFYPTLVSNITNTDWIDLIGTNLKAPLFLSQATAPVLRASGGLILNLADIFAMQPLRHHSVYSVAKAGLVMLTKSLAHDLGPRIRVNAIAPGLVMSPDNGLDNELQDIVIDRTALERPGSAADVARATLFFATQAPYITGKILAVDGGRSLWG